MGRGLTVSQLSNANKPSQILIKHLESATVFLRFAGVTESARAVEHFLEGVEVNYHQHKLASTKPFRICFLGARERTIATDRSLQITDFGQRRVLAAGAQEVAERVEGDAAVAALVEEGEGFFVVCGGLVGVRHFVFFRVILKCKQKG